MNLEESLHKITHAKTVDELVSISKSVDLDKHPVLGYALAVKANDLRLSALEERVSSLEKKEGKK